MDKVKKALADRVAEREDELRHIVEISSVKTFFGEKITLADVKPGDLIRIDFQHLDMLEELSYPNLHEGSLESNAKKESRLLSVKDIVEVDGKYFIETNGKSYSTMKMQEEWTAAQLDYKAEKAKELIVGALLEKNKKNRPTVEQLMQVLDVNDKIRSAGEMSKNDKRIVQDDMLYELEQIINLDYPVTEQNIEAAQEVVEKNINTQAIRSLQNAGDFVVERRLSEIDFAAKEVVAKKAFEYGLPVFYFQPESIQALDPLSIESGKEKEERVFGSKQKAPITLHAKISPMTAVDTTTKYNYKLPSLKLMETIKCENGDRLYVTNAGIFTSCQMQEAYRSVLMENNAWHQDFDDNRLTPQQYASLIKNSEHSILSALSPDVYDKGGIYGFVGRLMLNVELEKEMEETKRMLIDTIQSGRSVICVDDTDYQWHLKPKVVDANGIERQGEWNSIMPGDVVSIDCKRATQTDISSGNQICVGDEKLTVCPDEIYTIGHYYLMITKDSLYTNIQEVGDLAQELYKELEQKQELEEIVPGGDNR